MVTIEIRRHAERTAAGDARSSLSAPGLAMARALRRDDLAFDLVVSSPRPRARDTALAVAGRVDETAEILGGSPDEALTQAQYDAMGSQRAVLDLLGTNAVSRRFAEAQLALWDTLARRLPAGSRVLVVTHGGNIELPAALLAGRLGADIDPLPLSYCEGVRVEHDGRDWIGIVWLSSKPLREVGDA